MHTFAVLSITRGTAEGCLLTKWGLSTPLKGK